MFKTLFREHFAWGITEQSHELILECNEPIIYEDDNQTISATGSASLKGEEFLLLADKITWNRNSSVVIATGSVSLTKQNLRLFADRIKFSTESGDFTAENTKGGTPPNFFIADKLDRNGSVETYRNASVYISEPGLFEPNLSSEFYSTDENDSTFKIARSQLRVGNVIVGVLPGYSGKKRSGSWSKSSILKFGKDNSLGWYGETNLNYLWDDLTTSTRFTYYEDRGLLLSPQLTFDQLWGNGFSITQLNGSWVYDQEAQLGLDTRGFPLTRNRGHAHFSNITRKQDRWRSASLIEWESDSEIIRDFRRNYFYSNQWNQSHSELSYEGNGYTISVLGRWQVNTHEASIEQLPLLSLDSGPNPLPVYGLYHSSTLNYSNLKRRNHLGEKLFSVQRLNAGYKLEKSLQLLKGVRLTPSAAFLMQDNDLNQGSCNSSYSELGLDLHTSMYQTLPYSNETWEISEILHTMNYSIGFRNTERLKDLKPNELLNIFPKLDDLNLAPLDLLDHRNSEYIFDKKVIRFGWENHFLGKWKDQSRSLLSMHTYYDLNQRHSGTALNADQFFTDISIHPSNWISFSVRHKAELEKGKNLQKAYALNINDGRFQGASISYLSFLDFNKYTYFSGWKKLNEQIDSSISALYDLDKNFFTYWLGRIEYKSLGSWIWDFSIAQRKGTKKENNTELSIGISITGL